VPFFTALMLVPFSSGLDVSNLRIARRSEFGDRFLLREGMSGREDPNHRQMQRIVRATVRADMISSQIVRARKKRRKRRLSPLFQRIFGGISSVVIAIIVVAGV
jgi:hypothetical protein